MVQKLEMEMSSAFGEFTRDGLLHNSSLDKMSCGLEEQMDNSS